MARLIYYGFKVFGYTMLAFLVGLYFQREVSFVTPLIMIVLGMILGVYIMVIGFNSVINLFATGYSVECNVIESKSLHFVSKTGNVSSLNIICLDIDDDEKWFITNMQDLDNLGSNKRSKFWIQGSKCLLISTEL